MTSSSEAAELALDHLILGIDDLERGIERFERLTGVRPVFGGAHPGRGTQNALVSLGEGAYLEILAPNPEDSEGLAAGMEGLAALEELTPVGWALRTRDMEGLAARLRARDFETSDPVPGSRVREDGSRLEWRALGVLRPATELMPFFIEWSDLELHPSRTSPEGCRLESLAFEHPDPEAVAAQFTAAGVADPTDGTPEIRAGASPAVELELSCPNGTVAFPESSRD